MSIPKPPNIYTPTYTPTNNISLIEKHIEKLQLQVQQLEKKLNTKSLVTTQETNIKSAVTINSKQGKIITVNTTITPLQTASFKVYNREVTPDSNIFVNIIGGTYNPREVPYVCVYVSGMEYGSFDVILANTDLGDDLVGTYHICFLVI